MTTLRQIEANQRNSLKSSGPRTASGKEISRRNALKHGLSGAGVVLPDDEHDAIERRKAEWANDFQTNSLHEQWLFTQFITATVQIDRCQHEDRDLRTELAVRASACWEEDRQLTVAALAKKLPRTPDLVSLQLRQTPQGADWLLARWEALGGILEQKGDWTEAQRSLALDLLGVPAVLRDGPTKLDPIVPDDDPKSYRAALVAGEIARLKEARETFLPVLDAREQAAAELGLPRDLPRPLSLLRRYEASCERRMRKALAQLPKGGRGRKTTAASAATAPINVTLIDPIGPPALPNPSLDNELAELKQLSERLRQKEAAEPAPGPGPAIAPRPSPSPVPFSGRIASFSAVPGPVRASAEFEEILASTPRDHRRHPRRA